MSAHYSRRLVRKALAISTVGKLMTAGLGLVVLAFLARSLEIAEFGAYAALQSLLSLLMVFSSLGLDWASARYVPEYRVNASSSRVKGFVMRLLLYRFVTLGVTAGVLAVIAGPIAGLLSLGPWTGIVALFALVVLLEGQLRYVRISVMEPLMLQGRTQVNALFRQVLLLGALGFLFMQQGLDLRGVVWCEILASGLALGLACLQLLHKFARESRNPVGPTDWQAPPSRELISLALHNYGAQVFANVSNMHAVMILGTSLLGPAAMAGFGFCRSLIEQLRRYLPAEFFISVTRPKIIAAYSEESDVGALVRRTHFLYKTSLFVLFPIIGLFAVAGEPLLDLLTGGRYGESWYIALALTIVLVPLSHRVIASMTANILKQQQLVLLGAVISAVSMPLAVLFVELGWGPFGLAAALLINQVLFNLTIVYGLRRKGYPVYYETEGYVRLLLPLAAATIVLAFAVAPLDQVWAVSIAIIGVPIIYFALAAITRPYTPVERGMITQFFGIRRFIW